MLKLFILLFLFRGARINDLGLSEDDRNTVIHLGIIVSSMFFPAVLYYFIIPVFLLLSSGKIRKDILV